MQGSTMKPYYLLILSTLLFSSSAYPEIYKWVDENGRTHFSDKPNQNAKLKTTAKDLKKTKTNRQAATQSLLPNNEKIITKIENGYRIKAQNLFLQSKFPELNTLLSNIENSYKTNEISEHQYISAFSAFDIEGTDIETILNSWLKTSPSIYQPYLAKGIFEFEKGWDIRGNKYFDDTNIKDIQKFGRILSSSKENLQIAMHMKTNVLAIHHYLLKNAISLSDKENIPLIFNQALKSNMDSYYLHESYLRSKTPKWGGSFEELSELSTQILKKSKTFKKLKPLAGYIAKEAGDLSALKDAYQNSIDFYTQALKYGDSPSVFYKRGKSYYWSKSYQLAIKDITSAIEINPEDPKYYYWRAKAQLNQGNQNLAVKDLNTAVQLNPYDKKSKKVRSKILKKIRQENYAINQKNEARNKITKLSERIEKDPYNDELLHNRSKAYFETKELEQALTDIKKAIRVNPNEYEYYRLIDYILFESRRLDEIISYWKQYIGRNPEDGRAYSEMAGTYSQKGDLHSAMKYSKISADLGNADGFYAYKKFKEILGTKITD